MLSATEVASALAFLDRCNLVTIKTAQAPAFTGVLNAHEPGMTSDDLRDVVTSLAGTRTRADNDTWITPGDILAELRAIRSNKRSHATALILADRSTNGTLWPEGCEGGHWVERAWINHAEKQIAAGVPRLEAERAAWQHIRQPLPPDFGEHLQPACGGEPKTHLIPEDTTATSH